MSSLAIPSKLPAHLLAAREQMQAINATFATGLGGGDFLQFLSIRGKAFRVVINDEEIIAKNEDGEVRQSVTVVLAAARKTGSKRHFAGGYEGTEKSAAPDCWSDDAVKPAAEVETPRHHDCISCPLNAFGSKGKGKACGDFKRLIVGFVDHEGNLVSISGHQYFILDVAPMSGKNLRKYIQTLAANGLEAPMVITKLKFNPEAEYPELLFEYAGLLSERSFNRVLAAPSDEAVAQAIGSAPSIAPRLPAEATPVAQVAIPATPMPAPIPTPPIPAPAPKPEKPNTLPDDITLEWLQACTDKDALKALAAEENVDVGQRPRLESMKAKLIAHFGFGAAPVAAPAVAAPVAPAPAPVATPEVSPTKASLAAQVDAILGKLG